MDLITLGGRIALLIGELEARGRVGPLLALAAAREAADAAPEASEQAEAAAQALEKLVALGLVLRTERGVLPRPALARYAVGDPVVKERRPARRPTARSGTTLKDER